MSRRPRTRLWQFGKCIVCGAKAKVTGRQHKCEGCFHVKLSACFFCNDPLERKFSAPLVRGASTALRQCWDCDRKYPDPTSSGGGCKPDARAWVLRNHLEKLEQRNLPEEADLREGLRRELATVRPSPEYQPARPTTYDSLFQQWIDARTEHVQCKRTRNWRAIREFYLRRKRARDLVRECRA